MAGIQGFQGKVGFPGSQGSLGATGDIGSQGLQGHQGDLGPQGIQGLAGTNTPGVQGFQGVQGLQGAQGDPGFRGFQGLQSAGTPGNQGVQGLQGFSDGAQGLQAFHGPQGFQGSQGVQTNGPQGIQGRYGTSQGPQGNQGWQGVQGSQGNQGSGTQGFQGSQGRQGQGIGETGYVGFQGAQGTQGAQGATGSTGALGYLYGFEPDSEYIWYDDFNGQDLNPRYAKSANGNSLIDTTQEDLQGIVRIRSGGLTSNFGSLTMATRHNHDFMIADNTTLPTFAVAVRFNDNINQKRVTIGLTDAKRAQNVSEGLFFEFNSGVDSDRWVCRKLIGGTPTSTVTAISPSATEYQKLRIVVTSAGGGTATFYINGGIVATFTSLSGAAVKPTVTCDNKNNSHRSILLDYWYLRMTRT